MKRMILFMVTAAALSACATTPRQAATQTCPDGSVIGVTEPCPPPPPPPPPPVTCPDGTVVEAGAICPQLPPPPPPPPVRRSGERG
jgi:hypothetical protein